MDNLKIQKMSRLTVSNNRLPYTIRLAVLIALCGLCGCHQQRFSIAAPPPPTVDPGLYTQSNFSDDNTTYKTVTTAGATFNADLAKQARNNLTYGLMADIEVVYGQYYNHLFTSQGSIAIGSDALTLGLTSAASIATNAATKTIFSALGTGVTGVGLSVEKNLFAQQSFAVIAVAMQTRRDKIRTAIITNLNLDVTSYPLWAARRDLVSYFNAGTLPGGLQELQEEAGAATAAVATATTAKPVAPANLTAVPGNGQAALVWQAPAGAASYNLYYSTTPGVTTANGTKVSGIATTSATQTALTNGTPYYFIVTAVNSAGESPASNQATATPAMPPASAPEGAPFPPTLAAGAGNGQATLVWQNPGGATSFNLYYSTTPGFASRSGTKVTGITATSATQAALTNGTTYYFVVTAVSAEGESMASNQVSITPAAPPSPALVLTAH